MANSALRKNKFYLPDDIVTHLRSVLKKYGSEGKNYKGYKRIRFILDHGYCTYEQLKRIKNFFDYFDGESTEPPYQLNGGDVFRNWVEKTLKYARAYVLNQKKRKSLSGQDNPYRKPHQKDLTQPDDGIYRQGVPTQQNDVEGIMYNKTDRYNGRHLSELTNKILNHIDEVNKLLKDENYDTKKSTSRRKINEIC